MLHKTTFYLTSCTGDCKLLEKKLKEIIYPLCEKQKVSTKRFEFIIQPFNEFVNGSRGYEIDKFYIKIVRPGHNPKYAEISEMNDDDMIIKSLQNILVANSELMMLTLNYYLYTIEYTETITVISDRKTRIKHPIIEERRISIFDVSLEELIEKSKSEYQPTEINKTLYYLNIEDALRQAILICDTQLHSFELNEIGFVDTGLVLLRDMYKEQLRVLYSRKLKEMID